MSFTLAKSLEVIMNKPIVKF